MKTAGTLSEDNKHLIVKIREGVMTMDRLIQDLLRFSRTARQPLQVITIDMVGLVKGVITELTGQPDSRNISVTLLDLEPTEGDPGYYDRYGITLSQIVSSFHPLIRSRT